MKRLIHARLVFIIYKHKAKMVQGWIQSDNLMNLDKKQTNIALDVYYSSLLYRTKSLFQTVVKTENFFR